MTHELPRPVRAIARFIPAADRDWVLGDLIEDAHDRGFRGARRVCWLAFECAAVAAGLSAHRARNWIVLPPMREVATGLAVDGRVAFRGGAAGRFVDVFLFCGSVATLALGVELLVKSLLVAAGL
jgi:hypothetical protein